MTIYILFVNLLNGTNKTGRYGLKGEYGEGLEISYKILVAIEMLTMHQN
jgi:hypothetical protein